MPNILLYDFKPEKNNLITCCLHTGNFFYVHSQGIYKAVLYISLGAKFSAEDDKT